MGYADGHVVFLTSGTELHEDHLDVEEPALLANTAFDCARAIHFVPHDGKVAIFCDGNFGETAQEEIASTVWVLDESKFTADNTSAIVFEETLAGSHHGVAIPVDDDHVLYSLASPDRIQRTEAGSARAGALPATFQVTSYDGTVMHSLTDTTSKDLSCAGFHGESGKENRFALACDDQHGGILLVDYNPEASSYTSRALSYPDGFEGHRTGSFQGHLKGEYTIGNFAGPDANYLMAFTHEETTLTEKHMYDVGAVAQCAFAYEKSMTELVLLMKPDGVLEAVQFSEEDGSWKKLAELEVIPGMEDCSGILFEAGFGEAYVIQTAEQTLHVIDLSKVYSGKMTVSEAALGFEAFDLEVAGVPDGTACDTITSAASSMSELAAVLSGSIVAVMMATLM